MPLPILQTAFAYSTDPKASTPGTVLLGSFSSGSPNNTAVVSTNGIVFHEGVRAFSKFLFVYGSITPSPNNENCVVQISTTTPSTFIQTGYTNTDGAGGVSPVGSGLLVASSSPTIPYPIQTGYALISIKRTVNNDRDFTVTCVSSRMSFINGGDFSLAQTVGYIVPSANAVAFRFLYLNNTTFTGDVSLYGLL